MDKLKLITLNVNGIQSPLKRRALFEDLRRHNSDIILLQETHSTPAEEKIWLSEWGAGGLFSHGRSNARGVAILFSRGFNPIIEKKFADEDGRLLIIQFKGKDELFTVANLYAPTQSEAADQDLFIGKVDEALANLVVHNLFLGGDLNIQMAKNQAALGRRTAHASSYAAKLASLMEDYVLEDIWKLKNPLSTRGTFHRKSYSARLDYWMIPAALTPQASVKILPQPLSDHSMVILNVPLAEIKRGPGYWRFDNSLLTDPEFITAMSDHIQSIQQERLSNPNLQWEWTKYKIRTFCIQYKTTKNRERRRQTTLLENRLKFLAEENDLTSSPDVVEETASIKRELSEIYQTKASAVAFRTKARWALHGEKPTAYFLSLEKRLSKNNTITSLRNSDGHTITDSKDILNIEKEYFANIYKEDDMDLDPMEIIPLSEEEVPSISELHKLRINRPFTLQEFFEALKDLNKNKAPGTDGITPEFYIAFWESLKTEFFDSMEFSLHHGSLTDQQRTGIISLVPKKELDRQQLTNWRPITLLNTDTKILSKALAKRIQSCISEVISQDQTGFIRGRRITSNLLSIQSIIDHTDQTNSQGLLLALDYSKAFDTVRWSLIDCALQLFGFGEFIITVVATLFNNIKTHASNAGFTSDPFFPTRGIRQGCCASPSLFVLAVELMAIMVRKNADIKGISVAGNMSKISQYADDATFLLQDEASLDHLLSSLDTFSHLSGLRMNNHKSHLLLLGNHKDPPPSIRGIQVSDKVKILGIFFKSKMEEDEHYRWNFAPRLEQIKKVCGNWMNRNMSLKGKVTLINALMISVLQYPCACSYTPTRVLVEFKKVVTDFLWGGKRSKIAYNLIIQETDKGGLKMADLETRLQTIHLGLIRQIWLEPDSPWARVWAQALHTQDLKTATLHKTSLLTALPRQYQLLTHVLKTWSKYHLYDPQTESEVQDEPLWQNKNIAISMKPILWPSWRNARIVCINDLLHATESRFLSHLEISNKYKIQCSFLQCLQLRSAIPCQWKRLLLGPARAEVNLKPSIKAFDGKVVQVSETSAKKIYSAILPFKIPTISSKAKWNALYPVDRDEEDYWKDIYTSPYRATKEPKLQAFQYRIIHRTIPCNRYLCNIRIKPSDKCTHCNQDATDTLQHFFFTCVRVRSFWHSVSLWLSAEANLHIHVSEREFILGVPSTTLNAKTINFIVILAKFYIFRQKLFHHANLDLTHFLRELRCKLNVEKYNYAQEKKSHKFKPWEQIYKALG